MSKLCRADERTSALADSPRNGSSPPSSAPWALQHAVRWKLLVRNPADAVEPPKVERREMQVLDEHQTKRLLAVVRGTRLYIPVLLAVTTGLRRGEILALRWQDVDLDRGTLAVRRSLEQTRGGNRFKEPKTKRAGRVVSLPALTIEALRKHRVAQAKERLLICSGYSGEGLVCARNPRDAARPCGNHSRLCRTDQEVGSAEDSLPRSSAPMPLSSCARESTRRW